MCSSASSHFPWNAKPMIIVFQEHKSLFPFPTNSSNNCIALSISPHLAYNSNTAMLTNTFL
ncbi:hypothetical protein ACJIZ3_022266 [Penstemon smallii]|uniref:Uncharacterized protein n=1 Tax=Penstemon smallii TaxID=265156 RepID=A0ABD3TLR6_9LAMI